MGGLRLVMLKISLQNTQNERTKLSTQMHPQGTYADASQRRWTQIFVLINVLGAINENKII